MTGRGAPVALVVLAPPRVVARAPVDRTLLGAGDSAEAGAACGREVHLLEELHHLFLIQLVEETVAAVLLEDRAVPVLHILLPGAPRVGPEGEAVVDADNATVCLHRTNPKARLVRFRVARIRGGLWERRRRRPAVRKDGFAILHLPPV